MTQRDITGIAPFFIVRNVPAALAFYRDRLGFDITFEFFQPLGDTADGLRGFELRDADGYVLFFGRLSASADRRSA